MAPSTVEDGGARAVRFDTDKNEEIEPVTLASPPASYTNNQGMTTMIDKDGKERVIAPEDVRQLTEKLQLTSTNLQQSRMGLYDYQPFGSTPVSRVPSAEGTASPQVLSRRSSPRNHNDSQASTPLEGASRHASIADSINTPASGTSTPNKPTSAMSNLPLTPAASHDAPQQVRSTTAMPLKREQNLPTVDPSVVTPQTSPPRSNESTTDIKAPQPRPAMFTVGSDSTTPSREPSPASGATTPSSRPFTPAGDANDPYARSKRPAQSKSVGDIEQRFKFDPRAILAGHGHGHGHHHHAKHHSRKDQPTPAATFIDNENPAKHGSMSDLKRFFKGSSRRSQSPKPNKDSSSSSNLSKSSRSASRSSVGSNPSLPFADDNGLVKKYGKFGKVLGSGAGGSVRLMKRGTDGVTFAVKEFRTKHPYESEKDYAKKVTAEFCIGSTLHHGNIIETLDIVHERGKWYEVMEYCPYDLFATVMTGNMAREEIACCFMQILNGVQYLHSMGLAHRDLKLDNVVINEHGILKIIDFGSAAVFRYPFETDIVLAHGIVGSDPYLAPEVCTDLKYDPQPADVWSLAIIFCCMSLRRFPWKAPRQSDNSFKLFASPPSQEAEREQFGGHGRDGNGHHHKHRSSVPHSDETDASQTDGEKITQHKSDQSDATVAVTPVNQPPSGPPQSIRGPWRLLRLLPRESRTIIEKMLELKPTARATLTDIFADDWISDGVEHKTCRQEEPHIGPYNQFIGGKVCNAPGHTHTLQKSGEVQGESKAPSKVSQTAKPT